MNTNKRQFLADQWRSIGMTVPKVRYINYRKQFPNASAECWNRWLAIERFWGGKIILLCVRHHAIEFDFRRNWIADLITGNPK